MAKPLALFDIDKTMFNGPTYVPLIDAQIKEHLLDPFVARQTNDAMDRYVADILGYEDFVREVTKIWATGLIGKESAAIEDSTNRFFEATDGFFGYVKPTIELLKPTHEIVLITGSPQFTAKAVARVFGLSSTISTMFGEKDGFFTGQVDSFLATRHDKKDAIKHLADDHPFEASYGFGDSEGDIEMLRSVQHAVCIRPTDGLREIAVRQGWVIVDSHEELDSQEGLSIVRS
jgi:HAD superfamily hydrolase (TIGR01490 family)